MMIAEIIDIFNLRSCRCETVQNIVNRIKAINPIIPGQPA